MKVDTWMPIYWGDYAKDTGHLGAVHHGAYLMLIKHYWTHAQPLPADDDQLWRIACTDSPAHWRKVKVVVLAFFEQRGDRLHHRRIDDELAKAEGNAERRVELAKRAADARWSGNSQRKQRKPDAPRMPDACPPPSPSPPDNPRGITDTVAASAPAPNGARSPIGNLPASAKWAARLEGYKPWLGKREWHAFWGARPDQSGSPNPSIPPAMLRAWREEQAAAAIPKDARAQRTSSEASTS